MIPEYNCDLLSSLPLVSCEKTPAVSLALPTTCDHHAHFSPSKHRKISPSPCISSLSHEGRSQMAGRLKVPEVAFSICLFHGTPHQAMTCGNNVIQNGDRFTQSKGGLELIQIPSFLHVRAGKGNFRVP